MKRLEYLRKRSKLTQKQLANILGVSRATIGHWESGKYQPDLDTLTDIAKRFGVTVDYLIGGSNEIIEQLTQSEQKLIEIIRTNKLKISDIIDYANYKANNMK